MSARSELYELAVCGDDRTADEKIDAYRTEVLRAAADLIDFWHGLAPEVYAPADAAHLLRHIASGGDPKSIVYP